MFLILVFFIIQFQLLHESIHDEFVERLKRTYSKIKIGNPCEPGVLFGPVHSQKVIDTFTQVCRRLLEVVVLVILLKLP